MSAVLALVFIAILFLLIHGRNDRIRRRAQDHRPVRHTAPKPLTPAPPVVKGQPHGFFDADAEWDHNRRAVVTVHLIRSNEPMATHIERAIEQGNEPAAIESADELAKRRGLGR